MSIRRFLHAVYLHWIQDKCCLRIPSLRNWRSFEKAEKAANTISGAMLKEFKRKDRERRKDRRKEMEDGRRSVFPLPTPSPHSFLLIQLFSFELVQHEFAVFSARNRIAKALYVLFFTV